MGQPYRHMAADEQVCGTAMYVDDIKLPAGALHAALVTSTKPHARLVSVDTAAAAAMPGVHGVFTFKDVPGGNDIGPAIHDEELLASVRAVLAILLSAACALPPRIIPHGCAAPLPAHLPARPQEFVTCVGQAIAVVAAEIEAQARAAARAVVVEYEELPPVLDIDDAIKGAPGAGGQS